MIRRISSLVLLALTLVASPAVAQDPVLSIDISPGPQPNTTTWTFSGQTTAFNGSGFLNDSDSINPGEPLGMWGIDGDFTDLVLTDSTNAGDLPMTFVSGSATITVDGTSTDIVQPYFANGLNGGDDRIGFLVNQSLDFFGEGVPVPSELSMAGSIVVGGFDISAYAGGQAFTGNSTAFGNEPNVAALQLTVSPVVIPEPSSACLIGLVGLGIAARRRRSRV